MNRPALASSIVLMLASSSVAAEPATPLFSRHVEAVFSRLGCNGGTCHGAVQGKNGFRLSLFAGNMALDYERLVREYGGRRLNLLDPDSSLLLIKATAQLPHEGGKRMAVGSPEYKLLRQWIAGRAPMDEMEKSQVASMKITPAEQTLEPGKTYQLKVEAKFSDGSTEDVTQICSFESLNQAVAMVDEAGRVETKGVGDTALIVRYRSEPAMALAIVPRPGKVSFPDVKPHNFIDEHVLAKLRRMNLPPSAITDDATFLRRACLDVTGELPLPKEVRAFLADTDPNKRAKKIDELLKRPGYPALWAMKFCDILKASDFGVYADGLKKEADAPRFHHWVRARIEENTPYDEFAERILTASSREGRSIEEWSKEIIALQDGYKSPRTDLDVYKKRKTLDLYWQRKGANALTGALQVAHAFLGLRLECAQCHRHPHDIWQQEDLLSFTNFFMRVRRSGFQGQNQKKYPEVAAFTKKLQEESKKLTEEAKKVRTANKGKKLDEALAKKLSQMEKRGKAMTEVARRMMHSEIHHLTEGTTFASVTSPLGSQKSEEFRLLGHTEALKVAKEQDPRRLVVEWMRRADNPFFARAIVNRVWAHYFGRGIIDPPDNLSSFSPASHPELLDDLCKKFITNGYDLKWLHRTIMQSRTYQQDCQATPANRVDRSNYAYFYYRRLPAEVLVDALNHATGTTENMDMKYNHWPEKIKTVEIPFMPRNGFVKYMLEQFGRPKRNAAVQCDCERDGNASILQVMSLANHPHVWEKITDAKGRVPLIVKEMEDDGKRIEELFLYTLSRLPKEAELKACLTYLKKSEKPEKGLQGVLWSLINTKEFLLQH